MNKEDPTKQN